MPLFVAPAAAAETFECYSGTMITTLFPPPGSGEQPTTVTSGASISFHTFGNNPYKPNVDDLYVTGFFGCFGPAQIAAMGVGEYGILDADSPQWSLNAVVIPGQGRLISASLTRANNGSYIGLPYESAGKIRPSAQISLTDDGQGGMIATLKGTACANGVCYVFESVFFGSSGNNIP